jgi:hypothetical protein
MKCFAVSSLAVFAVGAFVLSAGVGQAANPKANNTPQYAPSNGAWPGSYPNDRSNYTPAVAAARRAAAQQAAARQAAARQAAARQAAATANSTTPNSQSTNYYPGYGSYGYSPYNYYSSYGYSPYGYGYSPYGYSSYSPGGYSGYSYATPYYGNYALGYGYPAAVFVSPWQLYGPGPIQQMMGFGN